MVRLLSLLFLVGSILLPCVVMAQQPVDPRRELEDYQDIEPLGEGALDDRINHDTGGLSFRHVDVDLPGNSDLPVRFSRRLENNAFGRKEDSPLADWTIGVPYIHARVLEDYGWEPDRCTVTQPPHRYVPSEVKRNRYWSGLNLHHPDAGRKELLTVGSGYLSGAAGSQPRMATTDYWVAHCISGIPSGGEGFLVTAPNGDKYRFDHLVYYKDDSVEQFYEDSTGELDVESARTDSAVMYASEVTDVNGNWVRYSYGPQGPTSITSNDGRRIDIAYTSGRISTVTANGRSWTYSYGGTSATRLQQVTLPDGRRWQLHAMSWIARELDGTDCADDGHAGQVRLTSPNGVAGVFDVEIIRNARTAVSIPDGESRGPGDSNCYDKRSFTSLGTTRKELTVPGAGVYTWQYTYPHDYGSWHDEDTVTDLKRREIVRPDGSKRVLYFNRRAAQPSEGLLIQEEIFDSGEVTPLRTTRHDYLGSHVLGESVSGNAGFDPTSKPGLSSAKRYIVRRVRTTITSGADQHSTEYNFEYNSGSSSYNYRQPVSVVESSTTHSRQRVEGNTYSHLQARWILDLPGTSTRNGKLFDRYYYDSLGRMYRHDRFGAIQATFGHYSNGLLAWQQDALLRRTSFGNYKRGTPQLVTRADTSTLARTVDNNGWVTSERDARGTTISYRYNSVGWLTAIDRPTPWLDTTVTYAGLGAGLTQTATRGSHRTTSSYDGLLRTTLLKTEALSGGGLTTYVKTDYDGLGRTTFTSFPSTIANPTAGTTTSYDGLGRITETRETVAPSATTSYSYLSGNRTRVTDPLGHFTTTTTQAYGSPENGEVVRIEQPEGVNTDMTYDVWGNVLTVRQYGGGLSQTQSYVYDSRLRLCRHSVPETNDTLYEYDNANQQTGIAQGQSTGTGCAVLPGSTKVRQVYDLVGQLTQIVYPDSTPGITINYDPNGNVTRTIRGSTDWNYTYNDLNLLTSEQLSIDGRFYTTTYYYNSNGYLEQQTTPASRLISYFPNGLGRPTSLFASGVNHASSIAYHPNGYVKSFSYANGHTLNTTQNDRQQLRTLVVQNGPTTAVSLDYQYDAARRITRIDDLAVAGHNRTFDYDGLGRLSTATGSWGAASYAYDALGNLRSRNIGTREVEMQYDGSNRLSSVRDTKAGGNWEPLAYDARGNVTGMSRQTFVPIMLGGSLTFFVPVSRPMEFGYDLSNQPVSVSGVASGTFAYDGNWRRVKQTVGGKTIYSVYSLSGDLLYRDNATDGTTTDYLRAGDVSVGRIENSTVTYVHKDHLGSPVSATNSSGSVLWREHYLPFGEKITEASANRDDEGFTGHVDDAATGLTYMQARYYDPVTGRFLSSDPVGFAEGGPSYFNRYAYVENDPVNMIDPSGLYCESTDGTTVCVPEDEDFPPFALDTPEGWEDFKATDWDFHSYSQDESAGKGGESYRKALEEGLIASPTPGEGAATAEGNIVDVDIVGPWGRDDVTSYVKTSASGGVFIVNVTEKNHRLGSGFVIRRIKSDGAGGYTISTYGEGNAFLQTIPGTAGMAADTWQENARGIIERAREKQ